MLAQPLSHDSRGGQVLAISITFTTIAALAVMTRFISRIRFVKSLGIEDWLVVTSLVFSAITSTLICLQVKYGLGKHVWDINPIEYQKGTAAVLA